MVDFSSPFAAPPTLSLSLTSFPAAIETNLHRANCYLPWPVGHMMSCDPSLVAATVHALCDRGPEEMRAARSMKYFSPSTYTSLMTQVVQYLRLGWAVFILL